jgi:adenosylcobinamide kinase/adenosylcobinamide-phosphate guanylyltransferase
MIQLILGGARSGKSAFAEAQAQSLSENVTYIATATVLDDEMAERIERHKADRPAHWQVVESPLALSEAIKDGADDNVILVDCLTLWLNNQLFDDPKQDFPQLFSQLISAADHAKNIIFVANEVGLGVIPMGTISRQFVDEAGRLNQQLAKAADRVVFVVAGLPQVFKGASL